MLQTLNIPSSPLPEVPSAQHGASGDAGERAEFAQLLQQAKAHEPEGAHDTPTVASNKDARIENTRARSGTRAAQEHKPHDVRRTRSEHAEDSEPAAVDAEVDGIAGCMKHEPSPDELAPAIDMVIKPQAPRADDGVSVTPALEGALPRMHVSDPLPAAPVDTTMSTPADERSAGTHSSARFGARELRLPTRLEAHANATTDGAAARAQPAAASAPPEGKDAAFDFALRQAAGGRSTTAPLFERMPLEAPTPAAAQLMGFARELQNPLGTRAEAIAQAALRAAPHEAAFAPALGAQLALWVKDGVQEARLQLHPAELGPVTVQIALDGQAAHIDFTAAVAATRESIEQSLPALAAALRESGFTLAGGGVFGRSGQGANDSGREHAPQGRGRGARGTAAIGAGADGDVVMAAPRRWARSLVDVYA